MRESSVQNKLSRSNLTSFENYTRTESKMDAKVFAGNRNSYGKLNESDFKTNSEFQNSFV